jgi:hypothetical protein
VIRADAVDPGFDVSRIDVQASFDLGVGLGDHLGFPGEAALALDLGLRAETVGTIVWARSSVHAEQCSPDGEPPPARRGWATPCDGAAFGSKVTPSRFHGGAVGVAHIV